MRRWWLRRRLAAFHCAVGHAGERIPRTHIDAFVFWLLVTLLLNVMQPFAHIMTSCAVITCARQIVPA